MNGAIFYTSLLQYGSVATYICYEGFIPDNTSTTRTCTANGWSGYEFLCRGKCFNLLNDNSDWTTNDVNIMFVYRPRL